MYQIIRFHSWVAEFKSKRGQLENENTWIDFFKKLLFYE